MTYDSLCENLRDFIVMFSFISSYKKSKYFLVSERVPNFKFMDNKRFGWRNYFHATRRRDGSGFYDYTGRCGNLSFKSVIELGYCEAFWELRRISHNRVRWDFVYTLYGKEEFYRKFSLYKIVNMIKSIFKNEAV